MYLAQNETILYLQFIIYAVRLLKYIKNKIFELKFYLIRHKLKTYLKNMCIQRKRVLS